MTSFSFTFIGSGLRRYRGTRRSTCLVFSSTGDGSDILGLFLFATAYSYGSDRRLPVGSGSFPPAGDAARTYGEVSAVDRFMGVLARGVTIPDFLLDLGVAAWLGEGEDFV